MSVANSFTMNSVVFIYLFIYLLKQIKGVNSISYIKSGSC